ncbi:MAG: hypothetical protein AAB425_00560, partial [Bdellovibrionota bacterium]
MRWFQVLIATLAPEFRARKKHGGYESKGRRKVFRPLVTKRPLHVTFKSSLASRVLSASGSMNTALG